MRAGFHPGDGDLNPSPNLYIWQMAEHDGRMYATTWDVGVFRQAVPFMIMNVFVQNFGTENMDGLAVLISNVNDDLSAIAQALQDADLMDIVVQNITALGDSVVSAWQGGTLQADLAGLLDAHFGQLANDVIGAVDITLIQNLRSSMGALIDMIETEDMANAIAETMNVLAAVSFFLMDYSNPAGFDIFYSDDGVNFYPYTVNGLGNANNYGGRNLLSTDYGLFVMTANPFTGCQVWLLNDVRPSISSGHPERISMKVGGTAEFFVESKALPSKDLRVTLGNGEAVNAKIELVGEIGQIATSYWSSVDVVTGILGQTRYVEDSKDYAPVYQYKVTLTGLSAFNGTTDISIEIGGMQFTDTVDLRVEENNVWVSVAIVIGITAVTFGGFGAAMIIIGKP